MLLLTEAVEAVWAEAKSFLYKFFKQANYEAGAAQSAFLFTFKQDPRGVDHEAVRRSRGCTVPLLF